MGPMAELLMKHITVHKDIEIISRGLIVLFPEPVNPKAIAVMRQKGIILPDPYGKEMDSYVECCESMIEWLHKVDNKLTRIENWEV